MLANAQSIACLQECLQDLLNQTHCHLVEANLAECKLSVVILPHEPASIDLEEARERQEPINQLVMDYVDTETTEWRWNLCPIGNDSYVIEIANNSGDLLKVSILLFPDAN